VGLFAQCFPDEFQQGTQGAASDQHCWGGDQPRRDCWDRQRLKPNPGPTVAESAGRLLRQQPVAYVVKRAPTGNSRRPQSDGRRVAVGSMVTPVGNGCSCRALSRSACSGHGSCWGTSFGGIVVSDRFSAYNHCHWATPAVLGAPNSGISTAIAERHRRQREGSERSC